MCAAQRGGGVAGGQPTTCPAETRQEGNTPKFANSDANDGNPNLPVFVVLRGSQRTNSRTQYGAVSGLFHVLLVVWTVGMLTRSKCTYEEGLFRNFQLESWVHWVWYLQSFLYLASLLGNTVPEMERQALIWLLPVVHGCLWLTFFFSFFSPTANTLAAAAPNGERPFSANGTFTTMILPLFVFFAFLWIKRHLLVIACNDTERRLRASWGSQRGRLHTLGALLYSLWSPLLAVGFWHAHLKPASRAALITDWTDWTGASMLVVTTVVTVFNGLLLLVTLSWASMFLTPVIWMDYYRRGYVFVETLEKPIRVALQLFN